MGDELTILSEAFHKIEKAGGQAKLSLSTSWLRRPPVFRWILPALSNSIPLRHLLLGGAK